MCVGLGGATLGRDTVARGTAGAFGLAAEPPAPAETSDSLVAFEEATVLASSREAREGSLLFTKRCCPASYTIDESRLRVTGLPERMVRETRVGTGAGARAVAVRASREG